MIEVNNPLVSVIVPVYNVEKYIDLCVQSIINQTYKNLEIILVDDASPDTSSKKCDLWVKKDKRIKTIHKTKNEGLFQARITGLEAMKGSFFTLVDSDDYLDTDFITQLLYRGLETGADIVIENTFMPVDDQGVVGESVEMPKLHTCENVFDGFMRNLSKESWGWCVWSKLYKSSVYYKSQKHLLRINRKINAAEDILFSTVFASFAEKVVYTEGCTGYYYRQNTTSITRLASNDASISRLVSISDVLLEMKEYMENLKLLKGRERLFDMFKEHLFSNYVWSLHNDYMKILSKLEAQNNDLNYAKARLEESNLELSSRLSDVVNSKSYKVGRAVGAPYNKIKRMLK